MRELGGLKCYSRYSMGRQSPKSFLVAALNIFQALRENLSTRSAMRLPVFDKPGNWPLSCGTFRTAVIPGEASGGNGNPLSPCVIGGPIIPH